MPAGLCQWRAALARRLAAAPLMPFVVRVRQAALSWLPLLTLGLLVIRACWCQFLALQRQADLALFPWSPAQLSVVVLVWCWSMSARLRLLQAPSSKCVPGARLAQALVAEARLSLAVASLVAKQLWLVVPQHRLMQAVCLPLVEVV
jgi:hypothetical protein